MTSCPSLEVVAGWAAAELAESEADAFEEHCFTCARCVARGERMLALVRFLGGMTPFFLTPDRRTELEQSGALSVVSLGPGESGRLAFGGRQAGLWVLRGDLDGVQRVDCEFVHDGVQVASFPDVPFDAGRGELALACRTHYQALGPARFTVRLTATTGEGRKPLGEYLLEHEFPAV